MEQSGVAVVVEVCPKAQLILEQVNVRINNLARHMEMLEARLRNVGYTDFNARMNIEVQLKAIKMLRDVLEATRNALLRIISLICSDVAAINAGSLMKACFEATKLVAKYHYSSIKIPTELSASIFEIRRILCTSRGSSA